MSEETSLQPSEALPFEPTPGTPLLHPEPPEESLSHKIFFGPSGLRPGWSILVYLLLLAAISAVLAGIVHAVHHPSSATKTHGSVETPASVLVGESLSFLSIALATWMMARSERRSVGVYGFGGKRKLPHFLFGFVWGAVFLSVLVGALWKSGVLIFDGRQLFGAAALRYGLIWAFGFLLVGLFEEAFLRGYLQYTLARGLASLYEMFFEASRGEAFGFWTAALLLSSFFGLLHGNNPGESPIGLLSAGLIGLVFCLTLWRTGSLWWALGFHASWDWAQSFLFGVADSGTMVQGHLLATHPAGKLLLSGGATGPEGSIYILPLLVVVTGVVLLTLPARQTTT